MPVKARIVQVGSREDGGDGGLAGGDLPVSAEGSFVGQVRLEKHRQNRFRLSAFGPAGREIELRTPEFAIVHGVSIVDPPLSRSVGVALSDDTVQIYFEKGTPLPARRTAVVQTIRRVPAGSAEDALAIPVVQGELSKAHLNRLIGSLEVHGARLKRDLPAGSRVEVTLHLDRSGQLHARADVPEAGESFEDVVHVLVPSASPEVLARELESAERRVAEVRRRGFAGGDPALVRAMSGSSELLAEARAGLQAAQGGDADAAARVHRLLLDLIGSLEATESQLDWPVLEAEIDQAVTAALSWIAALGSPAEQEICERALGSLEEARRVRDATAMDRQRKVLQTLANAAYARDPRAAFWNLDWYLEHSVEAIDPVQAQTLLDQGRKARDRGDQAELRRINRLLDDLFPGTAEERARSYGSGVR